MTCIVCIEEIENDIHSDSCECDCHLEEIDEKLTETEELKRISHFSKLMMVFRC